ncbi:MAG: polysaccharide deacetylase family protein [Firmicutes bacterium]|nr:polysaccharide deacetylase family protein [Bacillota bacterium]
MRTIFIVKKRVYFALCALALVAVLSAISVFTGTAKVFLGFSVRKQPVYRVQTDRKAVALTFDVGWDDEGLEHILAALRNEGSKATFFLAGQWAERHPEKAKQIAGAEMEIGTLGNTYPHMNKLNEQQIKLELETSVKSIAEAAGVDAGDIKVFRAPYGEYSDRLLNLCEQTALRAVQWDVEWDVESAGGNITATQTVSKIINRIKPGSIVRTDVKNAPNMLPLLLAALKNKGYSVVTLSELFAI